MHEDRAVAQGVLGVGHGLERLVVDLDQLDGALGDLGRERGDRRDDLALEAHDVAGKQGAVLDEPAVADIGDVVLREHREHAGEPAGPARVHAQHAGVGVIGIAEAGVQHPRPGQVGRVPAEPRDLVLAVLADERLAPLFDDRHGSIPSLIDCRTDTTHRPWHESRDGAGGAYLSGPSGR